MSPSQAVRLRWQGEGLAFEGGAEGGPEVATDSDGEAGPSPMQLLLLSLAGCMGVDLVMILEKSRVPVEALEVEVRGERAAEPPRRFLSIELVYHLDGPDEEHRGKVDRAVALSRDTYCSVLHTLREDVELEIRVELGGGTR